MVNKLQQLMDIEGFTDSLTFMEHCMSDSVTPGICMTENCDYSTIVEPDCVEGWCEECEKGSVKSALILAEII